MKEKQELLLGLLSTALLLFWLIHRNQESLFVLNFNAFRFRCSFGSEHPAKRKKII